MDDAELQIEDLAFGRSRQDGHNRSHSAGDVFRIVLATVPRTGNGWFRGLFESTTGLTSQSVFAEVGEWVAKK